MVVYTLKQRWEILRHYFENHGNVLAKKIIFSDEVLFFLGGYVNKQICHVWGTEHPHAYFEKHPKRVTVWCGFWSRVIIRPFFFENEQFLFTTLHATQPKLHSMFSALFLKISLSAAELMSFSHLWAAIWHRWSIICWVPSKISVTPTSQRQLTL